MTYDPYQVGPPAPVPGWDPSLVPPLAEGQEPPPELPYPGASQETPMPNDYWSRLAAAGGSQPFNFDMGRKPSGIEVILGLAAAMGNYKAAQAKNKLTALEEKNKRVRESASELAKHRHELRKAREMAAATAERLASQPWVTIDPATGQTRTITKGEAVRTGAPTPQPSERVVGTDGPKIVPRGTAQATGAAPAYAPVSSRQTGGPGSPSTPAGWVELLTTNQVTMSQVPQQMRNQVVDLLTASNSEIIPKAARDAIQSVNGGLTLVDQLEDISKRLKRGEGMGRFVQGARNKVEAFTQKNTDAAEYDRLRYNLSNLARAMGERGVLTDQDIARVLKSIPDLNTSGSLSKRQFQTLRSLMEEFKAKSVQSYSTASPANVQTAAPPQTQGMSDEQAYQEYLRMVGGKK